MVKVSIYHGVHESGTKFYTTALVLSDTFVNRTVIKNYGKVGQGGNIKSESRIDAAIEHAKIMKAKSARGYLMSNICDQNLSLEDFMSSSAAVRKKLLAMGVTAKMIEAIAEAISEFGGPSLLRTPVDPSEKATRSEPEPKPEPVRSASWGSW